MRLLRVDLLARGETLLRQRRIALQIALRVGELSLVLRLLRDGRVERGLIRARIDHREQVALLDLLALGHRHLHQRAVDAGAHQHGIERLHRAEAAQLDSGTSWRSALATLTGTAAAARGAACCAVDRSVSPKASSDADRQQDRNCNRQLQTRPRGAILRVSHDPNSAPPPSPSPAPPCCTAQYHAKPSLCLPGHEVGVMSRSASHCRRNGGRPPASKSA